MLGAPPTEQAEKPGHVTWSQLAFLALLASVHSTFSGHPRLNFPRCVPHFPVPGPFLLDLLSLQAAPASCLCLSCAWLRWHLFCESLLSSQWPHGAPRAPSLYCSCRILTFSTMRPHTHLHTPLDQVLQGKNLNAQLQQFPAHSRHSINVPSWRNEHVYSSTVL